jgi:hypothetical protein
LRIFATSDLGLEQLAGGTFHRRPHRAVEGGIRVVALDALSEIYLPAARGDRVTTAVGTAAEDRGGQRASDGK